MFVFFCFFEVGLSASVDDLLRVVLVVALALLSVALALLSVALALLMLAVALAQVLVVAFRLCCSCSHE